MSKLATRFEMKPKILCIHGLGISGSDFTGIIPDFAALIESIVGELEMNFGEYEFVYPEGEIETAPTSDVRKLYPPPYRCFYEEHPSVSQLLRSHEYLTEIVEEEGPFEGILGFSQGAEVAASLLFYQGQDVTFKFGVFIGGGQPFDVIALATGKDSKPVKMRAETHSARIQIPTAHVIGRSDAYREFSKGFVALCNPREVKVYDHKGAHIVPRGQEAMEDLTAALNWVVERAMYQ